MRHFANVAGLGVSGEVSRLVNRGVKLPSGRLSFMLASARALLSWSDRPVRWRVDGGPWQEERLTALSVCNGRYFGGGMQVAPDAKMEDGLFDVVTWKGFGLSDFVAKRRMLYDGTHVKLENTRVVRARSVEAEPVGDAEVLLDVDGESPGTLPARFTLLPGGPADPRGALTRRAGRPDLTSGMTFALASLLTSLLAASPGSVREEEHAARAASPPEPGATVVAIGPPGPAPRPIASAEELAALCAALAPAERLHPAGDALQRGEASGRQRAGRDGALVARYAVTLPGGPLAFAPYDAAEHELALAEPALLAGAGRRVVALAHRGARAGGGGGRRRRAPDPGRAARRPARPGAGVRPARRRHLRGIFRGAGRSPCRSSRWSGAGPMAGRRWRAAARARSGRSRAWCRGRGRGCRWALR